MTTLVFHHLVETNKLVVCSLFVFVVANSLGDVSRDRQDLAKINLMDETSKTEAE